MLAFGGEADIPPQGRDFRFCPEPDFGRFQRGANSRGITAPTASHNGRNVALAVPTRLFLSPSPPSLERVSHPRLPQAPLVLQRGPLRPVEQAMRTELSFQRKLRRMLVAAAIVGPVALTPEMSAAEGLLDFFFGGGQKQQQQTSSFDKIRNHHRRGRSS